MLINDQTVFRATATFLRTSVTRNTPFDRFLAGDNDALRPAQRRGARLFFTRAEAGGAGCFGCHSGPMLNKQPNDPDVKGIGAFVDQNFFNIGIGDHPVQALNALERGHLNPSILGADGYPYHAEDTGRQEITLKATDAFKFRSLTLRQLRDARTFFHNGSFTRVRDVVEYFNTGIPQDRTAGSAATLSSRFTHPRGPGSPRGLGLSRQQIDDLTNFLENALYDRAFVKFDPKSSTDSFQPNTRDLTYSKYHPELVAVGAKDGQMLSGLAIDDNDPLARRDQGLEFLDVTRRVSIAPARSRNVYRITNTSTSLIDTHLLVIAKGLPWGTTIENASGVTKSGEPYLRLFLKDGVLRPNQQIDFKLKLKGNAGDVPYTLTLLSGQGEP
jgi:hypothetical protein